MKRDTCWCGNKDLQPFSPDYDYCPACGTLVLKEWPDEPLLEVQDDGELYSKEYYLKRLPERYGYPDLPSRARADLSERVLHWLNTLLTYLLPPADVLELGSGHGGFVALLAEAGFRATGLELSPWLVEWSRQIFQIPVLQGPIEEQELPPSSLDAVPLMDVLEHLPDPEGTMRHAASLLRPAGFFLIQTPDFRESYRYEQLVADRHPFLQQFKVDQHLFLFSQRAVKELFRRLGFEWVKFEPAIFAHYDMFFVAARRPLPRHTPEEISEALEASRAGRIVEALLDLWGKFRESEADRAARGEQIAALTAMVQERDQRIAALAEQVRSLIHRVGVLAREARYWEEQTRWRARQSADMLAALQENPIFRTVRALGRWEWIERSLSVMAEVRSFKEETPSEDENEAGR